MLKLKDNQKVKGSVKILYIPSKETFRTRTNTVPNARTTSQMVAACLLPSPHGQPTCFQHGFHGGMPMRGVWGGADDPPGHVTPGTLY